MYALIGAAFAAQVLIYAPEGAPPPGGRAAIEIAVEADATRDASDGLPTLTVDRGVVEPAGEGAGGAVRFLYRAPADARVVHFVARMPDGAQVEREMVLPAQPAPLFSAPSDVEAAIGTPRIELRFPRGDWAGGDPEALTARVSEGRVLEVRVEPEAVMVAVEPSPERQARVMAVALLDTTARNTSPALALVRLRAHPQFTVTAEPGSLVSVRVGRRSYGPFVADPSGAANLAFDVLPGENTYEITVSDDLGNTQRSQGPLPSPTRPVVVGVAAPHGERGADVWVAAWTPSGSAWTGDPPICRSGSGLREESMLVRRGLYQASIEVPEAGGALFDPRVECVLADTSLALRAPLGAELPDRVELRVYPDALSADFPIAQVQAALLDRRGERLSPDALQIKAEHGDLQVEVVDGTVRGEYRGAAAIELGGDAVVASWSFPPGEGRAAQLEVDAGPTGGDLVVMVRARDHRHRPLAAVPVRARLGDAVEEGLTDARGWCRLALGAPPSEPAVLQVESAGRLAREVPVFPSTPAALPDPSAPDLSTRIALPIRAGRVRQVFLDVSPRPLVGGSGASGTILVRMLDAAGSPVGDESVRIDASEGEVGEVLPAADGSLQARYTPAPGFAARTVRITATSSAGTVATDLEVVPKPVNGGFGVSVGWISDFGIVSAPALSLSLVQRVPFLPRILVARVGVTAYALQTSVHDPDAEAAIDVRATLVPFDLGLMVLERWDRRSLHVGLAAVVAPYTLTADYGGTRGVSALALAPPGLAVQAGGGYRLGSSELYAEARYLLFTTGGGPVAFEGSVGGVSLCAGYRLLY